MSSIDNGIDVPNGRGRGGDMPPTQKKKSGSVPVTLTEIVGPQVWTGSYKFFINKVKNLQGL